MSVYAGADFYGPLFSKDETQFTLTPQAPDNTENSSVIQIGTAVSEREVMPAGVFIFGGGALILANRL